MTNQVIADHRRRKVLKIGVGVEGGGERVCVSGGGGGGARFRILAGRQNFRWLQTDWSPRSKSLPNNYISLIEN